jgi:hypothetical protein
MSEPLASASLAPDKSATHRAPLSNVPCSLRRPHHQRNSFTSPPTACQQSRFPRLALGSATKLLSRINLPLLTRSMASCRFPRWPTITRRALPMQGCGVASPPAIVGEAIHGVTLIAFASAHDPSTQVSTACTEFVSEPRSLPAISLLVSTTTTLSRSSSARKRAMSRSRLVLPLPAEEACRRRRATLQGPVRGTWACRGSCGRSTGGQCTGTHDPPGRPSSSRDLQWASAHGTASYECASAHAGAK